MNLITSSTLLLINLPLFWATIKASEQKQYAKPPNIVMLIADDLGIGDVGCFGNNTIKTPNIDRLAAAGLTLQHHLSAAGLCTPSRAALLTARYPTRYGLSGDEGTPPVIVHVASRVGLPESEVTIAEAFSAANYRTAIVGKWHLGSGCSWLGTSCLGPLQHGFHHHFGMLMSLTSVMGQYPAFWLFDTFQLYHQALFMTLLIIVISSIYSRTFHWSTFLAFLVLIFLWFVSTHYRLHTERWWQVSPWMDKNLNGVVVRNGQVIYQSIPLESIFQEMLNESVGIIQSSRRSHKPFFLIHSFLHVHTPMYASEKHLGCSVHGSYGDNVEEMDAGIGLILDTLEEEGLDEETIVYFVSDHGGHLEAIDTRSGERIGGYNQRFKGGKGMGAAEGAIRVPGIIRWKGVLSANSSLHHPTSLLDMLPTLLQLAGLPAIQHLVPGAKELDGVSFADMLKSNPDSLAGHRRILIHHCRSAIHGLRLVTENEVYKMYLFLHRWKANSTQCGWGENVLCNCFADDVVNVTDSPILYELNSDPYEEHPIDSSSSEFKHVVKELKDFLKWWRNKVPYPSSQYSSILNTVLLPWLQPFKYTGGVI